MKKICAVWVCGNVSNRFYSFHFSSFITLDKIPGTFGWGQKTTWTSHKILIDWFFCRYYLLLECLSVFDEISPTGDQSELFLSLKLLKCGRRMVKIVFSRIAIELKIEKFVYINHNTLLYGSVRSFIITVATEFRSWLKLHKLARSDCSVSSFKSCFLVYILALQSKQHQHQRSISISISNYNGNKNSINSNNNINIGDFNESLDDTYTILPWKTRHKIT